MKRYIGIDVSKARLDVAVHESGQCFSCDNTEGAVEGLVKQMKEMDPELIVMEATGGYERLCAAMSERPPNAFNSASRASAPNAFARAMRAKTSALRVRRRARAGSAKSTE